MKSSSLELSLQQFRFQAEKWALIVSKGRAINAHISIIFRNTYQAITHIALSQETLYISHMIEKIIEWHSCALVEIILY